MSGQEKVTVSGAFAQMLREVSERHGITSGEALDLAITSLYELHKAGAFKKGDIPKRNHIEIVSAPGDLCDGSGGSDDGLPCPGCRACS